MKKIVFIAVTCLLLSMSEVLTLLATPAAHPSPATHSATSLQVQSLQFIYKLDEKTRFLDLKNQWQSQHRGQILPQKAIELAREAYQQSFGAEETLTQWRYQGGPSPWIFSAKMHLYSQNPQAVLNVPVQVQMRAKLGELQRDAALQLTDVAHLNATARWMTLSKKTLSIPAVAPNEDLRLEVAQCELLPLLAAHPGHWPTQVEVQVRSPYFAATTQTLTLSPDHFVLPVLY